MNKLLMILIAALILFSGCVGDKTVNTVKNGDNISVDYTGSFQNEKVFDTSIEKVAAENNLSMPGRDYKPLKITVGKKQVIQGFDEGVIGMKVGETRTLTIPPEKGYAINPARIQVIPIVQDIPATLTFPKVFDIQYDQFVQTFGEGHNVSQIVRIPDTNINLTILTLTPNVSLSYKLKVGDHIQSSKAPWNETVLKIDDKNLTIKHNVKKGDTIQFFQGAPWDTTVLESNSTNITLRHNAVPDTEIKSMFGAARVHFNETSIIMDENPEVAGQTLIFNVTLKSIDK